MVKQSQQRRIVVLWFLEFVALRINGIMKRCLKINFFQIASMKNSMMQITLDKCWFAKITIGKINFPELCLLKKGWFYFGIAKWGIVQSTMIKTNIQSIFIGWVKLQSQQFRAPELNIPKYNFINFCQTQITVVENTIDKYWMTDINTIEIAMLERASVIFTPYEFLYFEINFLKFDILSCFHLGYSLFPTI